MSPTFPAPPSRRESSRIGALLRTESVGGMLLVAAAAIAIVWANSPWADAYFALRDLRVGYAPWHLDLTLGQWASDGLLAIFFFLVGLELKREFVAGDLREARTAVVPVAAAFGGVVVPALVYVGVVWSRPELLSGWAIPTATDIAFAVAVLALVGSHLPGPLRIFLLTLAVVDDLIAIVVIAIFYTDGVDVGALVGAAAAVAVFGVVVRVGRGMLTARPWLAVVTLVPIALVAWGLLHASGVHATIAGVALAFTVPVRPSRAGVPGLVDAFEHTLRPVSAGVAVPIFAFFAAGVAFGGLDGLARAAVDPVTIGIVAGLVVGKPVGILLTTRLVTAVTRARLAPGVRWIDLTGVGILAGIGFTVSLLIGELSFTPGSAAADSAKIAVLAASVIASVLATIVLGARNRAYRRQALAAHRAL